MKPRKLLISILNYGNHQSSYLKMIEDEFRNYKEFEVTILHGETKLSHRTDLYNKIEEYDLFLYVENDIRIKEDAILAYLKYDWEIPINNCIGFIRYENRPNSDIKYIPDQNPNLARGCEIIENILEINGKKYFTLLNVHQGCWLLTRKKLKEAAKSLNFYSLPHPAKLECAASGLFSNWQNWGGTVRPIFPIDPPRLRKIADTPSTKQIL